MQKSNQKKTKLQLRAGEILSEVYELGFIAGQRALLKPFKELYEATVVFDDEESFKKPVANAGKAIKTVEGFKDD